MVDVGDLREGVLQENVLGTAAQIIGLRGVALTGLGTNMGCFGGILPSVDNLGLLAQLGWAADDILVLIHADDNEVSGILDARTGKILYLLPGSIDGVLRFWNI